MSKKKAAAHAAQYVKKSSAAVIAGACLLAGIFIGVNVGLFVGDDAPKKPVVSVADIKPLGESKPQFDFAALQQQAQADAGNPAGWVRLGHAYFDSARHAEAIDAYEKALALDAGNADVWVDLGVMYRRSSNPQKAVDCFKRATAVNPRHETARFNMGIVLLHDLGDRAGALAAWENLLASNPAATTPTGRPLRDLVQEVRAEGS